MVFATFLQSGKTNQSGRSRASFATLAKQRKFHQIIPVLRDESIDVSPWLDKYALSGGSKLGSTPFQLFKAQMPLHLVLNYRPPVVLVDLLIARLAQTEGGEGQVSVVESQDMMGRSPLHLAVTHECDIAVIERLIQGTASSHLPRDVWGRTPLHWAVATASSSVNSHGCFGSSSLKKIAKFDNKIKCVVALLQAFPDSVLIKDNEGFSALELGVRLKADGSLLYLLDTASRKRGFQREFTVHNSKSGSAKQLKQQRKKQTPDTSVASVQSFVHIVPLEIVETKDATMYNKDDGSEISSVGTGGISKYHVARHRYKRAPVEPTISKQRLNL